MVEWQTRAQASSFGNVLFKQPGYQQCKINSISKELRNCKALVINEANTLQTKISKIEQRVYLIDVEMLQESAETFTS